jgi:hypothetical protein
MKAKVTAIAVTLAGALALGATASNAAPAFTDTTTVRAAAPSDVSEVRWRRGSRRNAAIAGFAAGTLLGLGVAAASRPYYYYDSPAYGYEPYYYYESGPSYYYGRSRGYSSSTPTY